MIDSNPVFAKALHFHIRWSTTDILDWQAFENREAAEDSARDLVQPNETFIIEECHETHPGNQTSGVTEIDAFLRKASKARF